MPSEHSLRTLSKTLLVYTPAVDIHCEAQGPVADRQAGRRVMVLDVALLVAGARERGELESRVTGLLADAAAAGDVILM